MSHNFVRLNIILIYISPILAGLLLSLVPTLSSALALKDIFLMLLLVFLIKRYNLATHTVLLLALPFILVFLASVLNSDIPNVLIFASFRQLITPYLFVLVGTLLINNETKLSDIVSLLLKLSLFACFFGFFERFTYLWGNGVLTNYFNAKNIDLLSSGYPFFFIEPISYQELEEHTGIVRMTSFILDPINFGHLMVGAFFLAKKQWHKGVFLFCLLASLSKGALIHFFIVGVVFNKRIHIYVRLILGLCSFITLLILFGNHAGFLLHLKGLVNALQNLSFFGEGIGHAGNYAIILGADNIHDITDSYLGAVLGQVGAVGFIFWSLPLFYLSMKLWQTHSIGKVILGQLIVAALSENTFNFSSLIFIFIIAGSFLYEKNCNNRTNR